MSEFDPSDPVDHELGAALRRRAGDGTMSTAAARDAVLHRAGTIRRRRAALGGGSALAALVVGGVFLLPRSNDEIGPAITGDVLPSIDETTTTIPAPGGSTDSDRVPITVDVTIPTSATTVPGSDAPSVDRPPAASSAPAAGIPSTSEATSTSASAPTTVDAAPSTSEPATTSSGATEPPLAPFTNTYQSAGGSIRVSWNGSALSLDSISPAGGYVGEIEESSATRVRVRFESADDDSRIEVRIDDGQVRVDIG